MKSVKSFSSVIGIPLFFSFVLALLLPGVANADVSDSSGENSAKTGTLKITFWEDTNGNGVKEPSEKITDKQCGLHFLDTTYQGVSYKAPFDEDIWADDGVLVFKNLPVGDYLYKIYCVGRGEKKGRYI